MGRPCHLRAIFGHSPAVLSAAPYVARLENLSTKGHVMYGGKGRMLVALLAAGLVATSATPALAHGGGLDANGGHYCREAGFNSGKCSPLNSYHSHGGGSSSGGSTGGGSTSGSGTGGTSSGTTAPAAPADTTAPDRPDLGRATVDGAAVQVPVTAEGSSTLRFAIGGDVVHTLTASGSKQEASFRLADGRHTVSVTATDAAGNTSRPADFAVTLDTTAPKAPALTLGVETSAGAETSVHVKGEKGSTYAIELDGRSAETESGTLSGGEKSLSWLLANGEYTLTATLTDDNGNESSTASETFTVDLPAPDAPSLTIVSEAGADPIEVAVDAPGATKALVTMAGEDGRSSEERVDLDRNGQGTLEFSGTDGSYSVEAVAVDFQDQRSEAAHLEDVIVKTSLPNLALAFVDTLLSTGVFAYELEAEEGATVRIVSETEQLLAEFTATGLTQEFSFEVPNGEHVITVSVIDAFGNETVEEFTAAVSSPLGVGGWIALLFLLALLAGAGFGLWKLWQRFRSRSTRSAAPTVPPPPPPPPPPPAPPALQP